jgi:hypothetical protein
VIESTVPATTSESPISVTRYVARNPVRQSCIPEYRKDVAASQRIGRWRQTSVRLESAEARSGASGLQSVSQLAR